MPIIHSRLSLVIVAMSASNPEMSIPLYFRASIMALLASEINVLYSLSALKARVSNSAICAKMFLESGVRIASSRIYVDKPHSLHFCRMSASACSICNALDWMVAILLCMLAISFSVTHLSNIESCKFKPHLLAICLACAICVVYGARTSNCFSVVGKAIFNPLPSCPFTKLSLIKYGVDDHPFCASTCALTQSLNPSGTSETAFLACKGLYVVPFNAALRSPNSFSSKVSSSINIGVA